MAGRPLPAPSCAQKMVPKGRPVRREGVPPCGACGIGTAREMIASSDINTHPFCISANN